MKLTENNEEPWPSDGWLTVSREYEVLCLFIDASRGILLRLMSDNKTTPALFSAKLFEITEPTIPHNWIVTKGKLGDYSLGPKAWSDVGFWERFFDGEDEAVVIFREQVRVMNS
jgi:hypothetical protein